MSLSIDVIRKSRPEITAALENQTFYAPLIHELVWGIRENARAHALNPTRALDEKLAIAMKHGLHCELKQTLKTVSDKMLYFANCLERLAWKRLVLEDDRLFLRLALRVWNDRLSGTFNE
jgi:hypothetical protein